MFLSNEKKRWDQYQQEKYKHILEGTAESAVVESQGLNLENEENIDYFLELESTLKLHRRLIRDVRVFHDEIKFQKKQLHAQHPYELYDIKFITWLSGKFQSFTSDSDLTTKITKTG